MLDHAIARRSLIRGTALAALGVLAGTLVDARVARSAELLTPLRVGPEDVTAVTMAMRPFRTRGPRLEKETLGQKILVHNYGHGGSGWSLSSGSAELARDLALAEGHRDIAVIGCGAIGLTTAAALQRAGASVKIYACDRFEDTTSARGTGQWTPDSRVCLSEHVDTHFETLWTTMCRSSYETYSNLMVNNPDLVKRVDRYVIRDSVTAESTLDYASLLRELTPELVPPVQNLTGTANPFPAHSVTKTTDIVINIGFYARWLLESFHSNGGRLEMREFAKPSQLSDLPEPVIVNCTGDGSRTLFNDNNMVPIPGQLTRTKTQEGINYGLFFNNVSFVPRDDGFVFQQFGPGLNAPESSTDIDDIAAREAVATIGRLFV